MACAGAISAVHWLRNPSNTKKLIQCLVSLAFRKNFLLCPIDTSFHYFKPLCVSFFENGVNWLGSILNTILTQILLPKLI